MQKLGNFFICGLSLYELNGLDMVFINTETIKYYLLADNHFTKETFEFTSVY